MKRILLTLLCAVGLCNMQAQDARLALAPTPPMGWMTWNLFQDRIDEQLIREMADAQDKSGRPIVVGICEWGQHNAEAWAPEAGGSVFRTSGDVRDMWQDVTGQGGMGILDIINIITPLQPYARRGCWFDMDMLVVGLYGQGGPSSDRVQPVRLSLANLGLTGRYTLRDVWLHKDIKRNARAWHGTVQSHETKVFVLQ
ncbi:MAG: hypothetical protein IJ209_04965 [Bacteroidaceae bacterium]|nr:hypothetical protein [Bacteroidaceae bacterium]